MARAAKDSRIMEMKDTISQLNTVINSQNELTRSLQDTVRGCNETIGNLQEQTDYLTKKLFGTSSEKSRDISGQLSLFNEAEQEAAPEEEPEPDAEQLAAEGWIDYSSMNDEEFEEYLKRVTENDV